MPQAKRKPKKFFRKKRASRKERGKKATAANSSSRVENAILETLRYRAVFDYPMSFYQLGTFLICDKRVSRVALETSLKKLLGEGRIKKNGGKYSLTSSKEVSWKKRMKNSMDLMKKALQVAEILAKTPWIEFIGVTGSVAAANAVKDDDIDLFFVTKEKRLWLTRGFVFVILRILGELRTDAKPNKKICPNIFVDEKNLAWNKKGRNIYTAHEVVMLRPVFDRKDTHAKFLKANDWAFRYFGNLVDPEVGLDEGHKKRNFLLNLLEDLAFKMQLQYMKEKKTKEVTTRQVIHFNKIDNTEQILKGFESGKKRQAT